MPILRSIRLVAVTMGLLWLLTVAVNAKPAATFMREETPPFGTIPSVAPVLVNADFECTTGYYSQTNSINKPVFAPIGWQMTILKGAPTVHSARIFFAKSCDGSAHVERINEIDSIVIRAQDLETPPEPGKPFDVAFSQRISATVGGGYSLSGWLLSLCGGSATPSDCPQDVYIAKMVGIDPTGGDDPLADSVIWTENQRNFWEKGKKVGWQQMTVSATAMTTTITIFARVNSPFRWHGNHAFIDAMSLVRAPVAALTAPAIVTGTQVTLTWDGLLNDDITDIAGGTHELRYDIQYRPAGAEDWIDFLVDQSGPGSALFTAKCADTTYEFRIRVRAEQPPAPAPAGAWPNHRYASIWREPISIQFKSAPPPPGNNEPIEAPGPFRLYLPQIAKQTQCQP
ncbi:MAG: fibronectin type III domain-containing protein [Caldilineaceae bacterium]